MNMTHWLEAVVSVLALVAVSSTYLASRWRKCALKVLHDLKETTASLKQANDSLEKSNKELTATKELMEHVPTWETFLSVRLNSLREAVTHGIMTCENKKIVEKCLTDALHMDNERLKQMQVYKQEVVLKKSKTQNGETVQ